MLYEQLRTISASEFNQFKSLVKANKTCGDADVITLCNAIESLTSEIEVLTDAAQDMEDRISDLEDEIEELDSSRE